MKAQTFPSQLLCECGQYMSGEVDRASLLVVTCRNSRCEHYGKNYALPTTTIDLGEALPSG